MNDLQIDYFLAVAINSSFTKAAEELFVSQPAISKQISLLEKETGVKLFERTKKGTKLTEAGELYFDFFREYKQNFMKVKQEALTTAGREKEIVHLGFLEGWDLSLIIPDLMKAFREKYPHAHIYIDCCGIKELSTKLLTGSLDVVVTFQNSLYDFEELRSDVVAEVGKILMYSAHSKYVGIQNLNPGTFRKENFFAPWGIVDKMVTRIIESYCEPYGFVPDVRFVNNNESMITCVRNNLGVAISDEWSWVKDSPDIRHIPLSQKDKIVVSMLANNADDKVNETAKILRELIPKAIETL